MKKKIKDLSLEQYIKERDEMLKKCSVGELRSFVYKYEKLYSKDYMQSFTLATDEVLEITLHKMIVNVTSLPNGLRQKSKEWLQERNYDCHLC